MFSLFEGLVASGGSDLWSCLDTEPLLAGVELGAGSGEHPGMGNRGFVCSLCVNWLDNKLNQGATREAAGTFSQVFPTTSS